jgi:hypothetical protein
VRNQGEVTSPTCLTIPQLAHCYSSAGDIPFVVSFCEHRQHDVGRSLKGKRTRRSTTHVLAMVMNTQDYGPGLLSNTGENAHDATDLGR